MFKSVFSKYILAFVMIILVSVITLSGITYTMIERYEVEKKADEVMSLANAAENLLGIKVAADDGFDIKTQLEIARIWQAFLSSQNAILIISDMDGNAIFMHDNEFIQPEGVVLPLNAMSLIESGSPFSEVGNLGGIFEGKYVTAGVPVYDGDDLVCAVFVSMSSSSEDALIEGLMETIVASSLWIMVAALIAVYFISDRIITPLKNMSLAARNFAKGHFDARIEVTGHDEIAELATAFNQMAESLGRLEKMRHSFIANVSHDLRTPMTTIAGFIEGILDGTIPPERQNHYLGIVHTEVKRLSRLVTELLDISKMQAGERKFNFEPFDICEMARVVLISFEHKIDEKRLDIEFDSTDDSMFAVGDKDAIHQIVYNLIDNALKFSRDTGKLRISIKESEHDHNIVFSVYNEGEGINEEDLPYVFERFYKSDKSRGLDKSGSGLGLYIARTIIEAHGQKIWAESQQGEYCEFVFTLNGGPRASRAPITKIDEK